MFWACYMSRGEDYDNAQVKGKNKNHSPLEASPTLRCSVFRRGHQECLTRFPPFSAYQIYGGKLLAPQTIAPAKDRGRRDGGASTIFGLTAANMIS